MKKAILIMTMLFSMVYAHALSNFVWVPSYSFTVPVNGQANLEVKYQFEESNVFTGYQFTLKLLKGISVVMNGNKLAYTKGDCYDATHTIGTNFVETESTDEFNEYNFTCFSLESEPFTGTSGIFLTIPITADDRFEDGDELLGEITNIVLGKVDGTKVNVSGTEFSFLVSKQSTGIEEARSHHQTTQQIFDLTGRRVDNPKKGLYIVNGKKVKF